MQRRSLVATAAAVALGGLAQPALGQPWPSRPIRVILPVPPGGGTDILARIVAPHLQERLGQPVLIENRAGGGMTIGTNLVAKAEPDGHTMLMIDTAIAVNPSLYRNLPYDTQRELQAVALAATAPVILVAAANFPPNTVAELLAYARANPGRVNFASGGNGTSTHLSGELLRHVGGIDIVHVPFQGSGPGVTALLGGQTQIMFSGISSTRQHVEAGRLKGLAVTGDSRSPSMPNIPTFAEAGLPEMNAETMWGFWLPAGAPPAIAERFARELAAVLAMPAVKERVESLGFVPRGSTPAAYRTRFEAELAKWAPIIRQAGIQAG
ncbi:MAG TPA: tripartite tricarboxylate transporter substrate binding protein [Falsiroseomonas sp.]|jgi:tripartite-type tricarboxylate transporter receptor subunit TctC|nr:tripartite tricarboxylate transporter substrate binding protein [Falsiroseomonas sp.]